MSYRDELEAAHARIEGLERQLASGEPLRETETVRALRDEVDVLQQQLAAHRSIATHSQASLDAHPTRSGTSQRHTPRRPRTCWRPPSKRSRAASERPS